jgi:membrane protein DedA with SNARE-associated domain
MIEEVLKWLLHLIDTIGYAGIVILMAIESSFIPFPSEIVIPPAGYLAAQGKMNLLLVIISGIIGSIIGAYVNYFIAKWFGEAVFLKIGKPFGLKKEHFEKAKKFFYEHGAISTFTGRLLPVIRQYISIPAGIAKMSHIKFMLYTATGAGIWNAILAMLGYYIGNNEKLLKQYSKNISVAMICLVVVMIIVYIYFKKKNKKGEENADL